MNYQALNSFIFVTPKRITNNKIIISDNEIYINIGVRDKWIDGKKVLLSECLPLIILSSPIKELKKGDVIYVRNSHIYRIASDKDVYYVEENKIQLLEKKPYKDNVLCRDIAITHEHIQLLQEQHELSNAFVYDAGNSELKQGDVIIYNPKEKNEMTIANEKLFTIDKKQIVGIVT